MGGQYLAAHGIWGEGSTPSATPIVNCSRDQDLSPLTDLSLLDRFASLYQNPRLWGSVIGLVKKNSKHCNKASRSFGEKFL